MKLKIIFFLIALFQFSVYGQSFFEKDWKTTIDTTWEPYYSTDKMIEIYDSIWTVISNEYACFQYLNTNWDSLKQNNRIEILQGVSTGRFVAILNHFARRLKESHTLIGDAIINQNGNPKRGTPQIYQGGWGRDSHFGAALSPLPDSSLLVYSVIPNHPLGLELGDVILGYEGIPWKVLYKTLLEMEFPFGGINLIGSNDDSETENWLKGAGNNWHLFESIDFVKYGTEDTLHLPTSLLEDQEFDLYYSGQIPVKGVNFYDNKVKHPVSWGVVENTNVGYVYIWSWKKSLSSLNFKNAIDSLVNIIKVDGLILDVRANTGGYIHNFGAGLNLLFKKSPHSFSLAVRESIDDFYSLRPTSTYSFHTDSTKFYDGPIAVLSGASSISATDFFLYRMREHPKAKIFGSTPTGSYCSPRHSGIDRITFSYAWLNGYSEAEPDKYLTHTSLPVDFKVSFTAEDVVNGDDTVVKEALKWINSNIITSVDKPLINEKFDLLQNYPNPFNPTTTIKFEIPTKGKYALNVFNILGQNVATLVNGELEPGIFTYVFDASKLASGVYFYSLSGNNIHLTKKMIYLK